MLKRTSSCLLSDFLKKECRLAFHLNVIKRENAAYL